MQLHLPELKIAESDLASCRDLLRCGSKSFASAANLLPNDVRESATVLYAFCREADDAIDRDLGGSDAVARLRTRLDDIYSGTPGPCSTDRALAVVVTRYALPRTLLDALIEGFEWDAQDRRYASIAELETYAARVAGTIGAMMAVLMGVRKPSVIARACDLGVAMQLTNIARDIGEDARAGRLYLPTDWLIEAGIDPDAWLADPKITDAIRHVTRRLLRHAGGLYDVAKFGVHALPPACRPGIHAARLIYADIGRKIAKVGYDSVTRRAVVSRHRKVWLLMKAYSLGLRRSSKESWPPLPAVRYLVDAVAATIPAPTANLERAEWSLPWWRMRSRSLWLLDLFERMERRERAMHGF